MKCEVKRMVDGVPLPSHPVDYNLVTLSHSDWNRLGYTALTSGKLCAQLYQGSAIKEKVKKRDYGLTSRSGSLLFYPNKDLRQTV